MDPSAPWCICNKWMPVLKLETHNLKHLKYYIITPPGDKMITSYSDLYLLKLVMEKINIHTIHHQRQLTRSGSLILAVLMLINMLQIKINHVTAFKTEISRYYSHYTVILFTNPNQVILFTSIYFYLYC